MPCITVPLFRRAANKLIVRHNVSGVDVALKREDACRRARGTNAHYTTLFIAFYNPVAQIKGGRDAARRYQRNRKNSGQTSAREGEGNANFAVGNLIISFRAGEFKDFIKSRLKCRRRVSTRLKNFITLFTTFLSRLSVSSFSFIFTFLFVSVARETGDRDPKTESDDAESRKGTNSDKAEPSRPPRVHPPE